jgi:WD40 repeat protein
MSTITKQSIRVTLAVAASAILPGCGASPSQVQPAKPSSALTASAPKARVSDECAGSPRAVAAGITLQGDAVAFALDDGRLAVLDTSTGAVRCARDACGSGQATSGVSRGEHPGVNSWDSSGAGSAPQRDCRDVPCSDSIRQRILWHPGGQVFATANPGGICVVDRNSGEIRQQITVDDRFDWSHDLKFGPDGQQLALARGQDVMLWDFRGGMLKEDPGRDEIRGHFREMQRLEWHPKGRVLATAGSVTGGSRGTGTDLPKYEAIRLWNVANGRQITALIGMTTPIGALAWSRDGDWLAAHDRAGTWGVWRTTAGGVEPVTAGRVQGNIIGFAISPHGERVAAVTADGRVLERETRAGAPAAVERKLSVGPVLGATYSADGRLMVAGRDSTAVCACGCEEVTRLNVESGQVLGARTLADGAVGIASANLKFARLPLPAQRMACSGGQSPAAPPDSGAAAPATDCRRPETSALRLSQAEAEYKRAFPAPGWAGPKEPKANPPDQWSVACFVLHATRNPNYHIMVASVFISPLQVPANLKRDERIEWIRTLTSGAKRAGIGPEPAYAIKCPEKLFTAAEAIAGGLEAGSPSKEQLMTEIAAQREEIKREQACVLAKWGAGSHFR